MSVGVSVKRNDEEIESTFEIGQSKPCSWFNLSGSGIKKQEEGKVECEVLLQLCKIVCKNALHRIKEGILCL